MKISRFVGLYSQGLAWVGTALLIALLVTDPRWLGQIPEIVVLFGASAAKSSRWSLRSACTRRRCTGSTCRTVLPH